MIYNSIEHCNRCIGFDFFCRAVKIVLDFLGTYSMQINAWPAHMDQTGQSDDEEVGEHDFNDGILDFATIESDEKEKDEDEESEFDLGNPYRPEYVRYAIEVAKPSPSIASSPAIYGDVRDSLKTQFERIENPGRFYATFQSEGLNPGLAIGGLRKFGSPLVEHDVRAIIAESHKAPYGKGTETLVDEEVRKTWEIDGRQISLLHPQWPDALEKIIDATCEQMGIPGGGTAVEAQLYKLLIYENGAMFKPHRE
jgi:hypothetical protein